MEGKANSQNKARITVLAVFAIGVAAGALSMNLYQRLTATDKDTRRQATPVTVVERLDRELKLSGEQEQTIRGILEETFGQMKEERERLQPLYKQIEPRFAAIRQKSRDRIRAELSEDQLPKFEEILKEEDRKREEYRQNQKK
jgi:hypothetical protein